MYFVALQLPCKADLRSAVQPNTTSNIDPDVTNVDGEKKKRKKRGKCTKVSPYKSVGNVSSVKQSV